MNAAELAVKELLSAKPITQQHIAKSEQWIGTHPKHEGYPATTSRRMVRQIIRTLRIKYKMPILSGKQGYFLPESIEQVLDHLTKMEREVRARNKASLETYQALRLSGMGFESAYFEQQSKLEESAPPIPKAKQVDLF